MESVSSENTIASTSPNRDEDEDDGSISFQPQNPYPREESEAERRRIHNRKKSCKSNCINGNLVALKALLFIFYGGMQIEFILFEISLTSHNIKLSSHHCLLIFTFQKLHKAIPYSHTRTHNNHMHSNKTESHESTKHFIPTLSDQTGTYEYIYIK